METCSYLQQYIKKCNNNKTINIEKCAKGTNKILTPKEVHVAKKYIQTAFNSTSNLNIKL